MITVILAYFMLRERLSNFEVAMMVLTLLAIVVIIVSGSKIENSVESRNSWTIMIYVILLINSLLSAGGNIALRTMKKFHESVILWYSNWVTLIFSLVTMLLIGQNFEVFYLFNTFDCILLFTIAFASCVKQICKVKALKL